MKKSFIVTLLITSFMLVATVAFVAFNESYSTANAMTAACAYASYFLGDCRPMLTSEAAPIGFGSTQISQITDSELSSGGLGVTGVGHTMTIYVTPDVLVFGLIFSLNMFLLMAVAYLTECLIKYLLGAWRNRRKIEEVTSSQN